MIAQAVREWVILGRVRAKPKKGGENRGETRKSGVLVAEDGIEPSTYGL